MARGELREIDKDVSDLQNGPRQGVIEWVLYHLLVVVFAVFRLAFYIVFVCTDTILFILSAVVECIVHFVKGVSQISSMWVDEVRNRWKEAGRPRDTE